MSRLTLTLLGTPQIVCDGTALSFAYRKVAALLIYLAVETRQGHTRAALAGLLWSDTPDQVARQSLSQALTTLRVALGERAVSAVELAEEPYVVCRRAIDAQVLNFEAGGIEALHSGRIDRKPTEAAEPGGGV